MRYMKKVQSTVLRQFIGDKLVLVVEPTLNYKNSIRGFLYNLKINNVKFVNNAREARREMLTAKVGMIIAEWDLPDENGIQFCKAIRSDPGGEAEKVAFLLVTVENMKKDVILASEVGIDGYLLKPFSYEDFSEAVLCVAANKTNPGKLNQLLDQAEELLAQNLVDSAQGKFQEAERLNPASARAICGVAQIFMLQGQPQEAMDLYRKAIQLNADYIEAYRQLITLLQRFGSPEQVIELGEKMNALSPGNPKYTMILAQAELAVGHIRQSEEYFRMTIRLSPKLAEAYKGLGKINMIQEDYDSAMKNFTKAIDLDPEDISTLNSIGLAYVKMNRYVEGVEKYRAALKMKPDDCRILFNIGYAKEKLGETEQARHYYKLALQYDSGFEKAARRLERLEQKGA